MAFIKWSGGFVSETPYDGQTIAETSTFERFRAEDVRDLVREYPLAWVSVRGPGGPTPSLLPLLGEYDTKGRLVALVGHFARRNPLFSALLRNPSALVLFQGPSGYVSPDQAGRRDWAPTWNYAQISIEANIEITPDGTDVAVRRLVTAMEADRPVPWDVSELGVRYSSMLNQIVGFRAEVVNLVGRFKLSQDENLATARAIIATTPDRALARWMARFNADRL
jgi:transcriptional regulator